MIRSLAFAALAVAALSLPSAAATVFSTDFSTDAPADNGGPGGFTVTGQVDIVGASNIVGITTPGGTVIDLDGTGGPGTITSAATYAFGAGDRVSLEFLLGGAQRGSTFDDVFAELIFGVITAVEDFEVYGALGNFKLAFGFFGPTFKASSFLAGTDPFAATGLRFTAVNAGTLQFSIGTPSADAIGPLVAGVTLDIAPIPLPAAGPVLLLGLGLLAGLRRRKSA